MPLAVSIERPEIPDELQRDLYPVEPEVFVAAVDRALRSWEAELEGFVRFERSGDHKAAQLRLRLLAERAPTPAPEVVVLGVTEALIGACKMRGVDPEAADRMRVSFDVPELVVYLADEHGLLNEGQVERIALHEIGHALGMLGHSPNPSDLMYAAYRERTEVRGLSTEDVNSFVSLYRLPSGSLYSESTPNGAAPPPPLPTPPAGEPRLALAPYVDGRFGFELSLPDGWIHVEAEQGVFAANGPIWSHDASLEVLVSRHPTLESFMARYGGQVFADSWYRGRHWTQLAGQRALALELEDDRGRVAEVYWLIERPSGVVMVVARSPSEFREAWRPWFERSLETLVLWDDSPAAGRK
jgi:hypothetical protein